MLDLLGGGVHLLLALLGSTTQTQDKMQGRFLLNVVVRKSSAILKLLAGEDQTLLVGWNSFLVYGEIVSFHGKLETWCRKYLGSWT